MKNPWKIKGGKAWIITSSILIALMLAVFIATTQVPIIYGTLKLVLGEERLGANSAVWPTAPLFKSKYESKDESAKAAYRLSEEICEEGIILLKNEQNALPINAGAKISVFGKNSINMVYGGSGSGGRSADSVVNLYQGLEEGGFSYNPTLKAFYENNSDSGEPRPTTPTMGTILTGFPIAETPKDKYTSAIKASYDSYSDAAIVVLTRIGGEGYDLPRTMFYDGSSGSKYNNFNSSKIPVPGAFSATDHYLQIDKNETDLLQQVCDNFDKVILLLNTGTSMELGFLDRADFWVSKGMPDYSAKIQAALWVGNLGGSGNTALAKILKGEVNPSGKTVDTFVRDFTQDPSWYNFGNNLEDRGNEYFIGSWGTNAVPGRAFFERYEESIYMGYRYWETRGEIENDGGIWYRDNVVYPLGYGLSYTDFSWSLVEQKYSDGSEIKNKSELSKDKTITYKINVKNNGTVAGRDTVQLYYTAPYYQDGIEKAHVVLGDFAKTGILKPNAEEVVTLTLKVSDMSSYDWSDKNTNGFKGYELDPGSYIIRFASNAHEFELNYDYTVPVTDVTDEGLVGYQYRKDTTNDYDVVNRFDSVSEYIQNDGGYMTRSNLAATKPSKFPKARNINVFEAGTEETAKFFDPFIFRKVTAAYDVDKPWYTDVMPKTGQKNGLVLSDLTGVAYNDEKWDTLLNQLTIAEMDQLIGVGAFSTKQVESIKKPITKEFDGPGGFVVGSFMSLIKDETVVTFFPCESLIGATWSKDIARRMGEAVGDEGIWGTSTNGISYTMSGWYAPAINLHRSQFGGRNFEYYSEDPVLSGLMAAEVALGAQSNGTYCYLKHFVLNDQETSRSDNGVSTWVDEQAMREIYFKPFEISIKKTIAGVEKGRQPIAAVMSSFNRIGNEWTGSSYSLLTEVLRNEWGFNGSVITDFNNGKGSYMDLDMMIRGGGDLNLFQSSWLSTDKASLTPTQVTAMRKASKNILYTVANSNGMNNPYGKMDPPIWVVTMYCVFAAIVVGIGTWGFFVIRGSNKSKQKKTETTSKDE